VVVRVEASIMVAVCLCKWMLAVEGVRLWGGAVLSQLGNYRPFVWQGVSDSQ
jgi:hypothetical protein